MASAEAFKRLKPPVAARPERSERPSTRADRRHDGQQRRNRNAGPQRHPQRADGHPAHRSGTQDRTGQRRDEQRNDGARSSYRPEAYREAAADGGPGAGQRPPQPNQGRDGFRSTDGQPKRKFRGRRGGKGGYRAA